MRIRALLVLALTFSLHSIMSGLTAEGDPVKVPASPAKPDVQLGLESGYWGQEPNSNATALSVITPDEQPENKILRIEYKGGAADKAAIKKQTSLNVAETGKMTVWIYTADEAPPGFSIALNTGPKYDWQETETTRLKKGWNEIIVDLAAKAWKSQATEWKNAAALAARNDVRGMALNIYNGQTSGVIFVDALQIDQASQNPEIDAEIKKLNDAATRDEADKALTKIGRPAIEKLNAFVETSKDKDATEKAMNILQRLGARPVPAKK